MNNLREVGFSFDVVKGGKVHKAYIVEVDHSDPLSPYLVGLKDHCYEIWCDEDGADITGIWHPVESIKIEDFSVAKEDFSDAEIGDLFLLEDNIMDRTFPVIVLENDGEWLKVERPGRAIIDLMEGREPTTWILPASDRQFDHVRLAKRLTAGRQSFITK